MQDVFKIKKALLAALLIFSFVSATPFSGHCKKAEKFNISGCVTSFDGSPLANVPVSDGLNVVLTDSDGCYRIASDLSKRSFVSITVPGGYFVDSDSGRALFYKRIPEKARNFRADFVLKPQPNGRHTILMTADPQLRPRGASYDVIYPSMQMNDDLNRAMREYAGEVKDRPVYGIVLGDIVHNEIARMEDMVDGYATLGFPSMFVPGNHDHIPLSADERASLAGYEEYFGPANYSLDIGDLHYVFLDNVAMKSGRKDFREGLDETAWQWLQNDLQYVPYDRTLVVCSHVPMMRGLGDERSLKSLHGKDYSEIFAKYKKVYLWAGHVHSAFSWIYGVQEPGSKFSNMEVHNLARSTGSARINLPLCMCGTPRGFLAIDVDGESVEWKFIPYIYENGDRSGLDASDQMRLYPPTAKDGKMYANVWPYDAAWKSVVYRDCGKEVEMELMDAVSDKGYMKYYRSFSEEERDAYRIKKGRKCVTMFSADPSPEATSATVTATDRFGNVWTSSVSWRRDGVVPDRAAGSNLRIMDDNIWDFKADTIPAEWVRLGEDCRNEVRAVKFANMFSAFRPDVLTLQEFSEERMGGSIAGLLKADGYVSSFSCDTVSSHTPIWYNPAVLELVESSYHRYTPAKWSNGGSKSYNTAVFRHVGTGRLFIVANTHLWWRTEKAKAGSNAAREEQVRTMMAAVDALVEKYDCPVFLMGDMNCGLESRAMRQLTSAGYIPVWDLATVYGDRGGSHHYCKADGFSAGAEGTFDPSGRSIIDQFFLYNGDSVEIKVFERIRDAYTLPMTDHYPNYVDLKL